MKSFSLLLIFSFAALSENQGPQVLEVTPEFQELLVDIDPKGYGYRARAHDMSVGFTGDFFVRGRLSLDYQIALNPHFKLVFPVSFENAQLLLPFMSALYASPDSKIKNQWALMTGVGIKFRLSEWMAKSSFYTEILIQAGVYSQDLVKLLSETRHSIRFRPSLFVGWERVFETGLVFGVKTGVEYNFDVSTGKTVLADNQFSVVPAVNLGFAW